MAAAMTPSHMKFGTGNPAPQANAQPSFGRVFLNGVFLGLGWMTALGIISYIKKVSSEEREATPISNETEY
jgi:hypothetical protein